MTRRGRAIENTEWFVALRSRIDNIAPGACITCLVATLEVERARMEDSGAGTRISCHILLKA